MVGIYKIENLKNGHKYIGQSVNIAARWNKEKINAFKPQCHEYNYPLSKAFRKYGLENFSFEIIEECSIEDLNTKERYWIAYYNTFYNGYNQTLGGDSPKSKPKEQIIGVIQDLENTDLYHREIAEKWNISQEMVQGINTGRYWFQEDKKYPLQKKHKNKSRHLENGEIVNKQKFYCKNCGSEITSKAKLCVECSRLLSRKVDRPDANTLFEYLKSINGNFLEAGRHFGVSDNAVRKWCKSYNIPSTSAEYKKNKKLKVR